jgi:hypothetical protein
LWKGHKSIGEIVYESVRQDIPSHANKSVTAEIVKVGGQIYDS